MDRKYFLLGGFVAFSLYFSILTLIFYKFYEEKLHPKNYSYHKKDFLEITIVEEKQPKKIFKANISKEKEIQKPKKELLQKKESRDKKENINLKSLFSTVRTEDYKKIAEEKRVSYKTRASRLKKQITKENLKKTKKILKLIKELKLSNKIGAKASKRGEYNEYIGKIQEIIDLKWQQTPQTFPGNKAIALIKIDKYGRFSYKIEKLSYNNTFNIKLKEFLESLKYSKFPPYKKGRYIEIKIEFKDE